MENIELDEAQLVVQEKDKYLESLKSLNPAIYNQLAKLLSYLGSLSWTTRQNEINALKTFEPLTFMNMKMVSLVILYANSLEQDPNVFLEDKYKDLLLESTSTLDIDKKLTDEYKRNVKINFASYWKKLGRTK